MLFTNDLGTGLPNLGNAGCVFESGLVAAINMKLSCILKWGAITPGVNDWSVIRIKNYAAIVSGMAGF